MGLAKLILLLYSPYLNLDSEGTWLDHAFLIQDLIGRCFLFSLRFSSPNCFGLRTRFKFFYHVHRLIYLDGAHHWPVEIHRKRNVNFTSTSSHLSDK